MMVTLATLCSAHNQGMMDSGDTELVRIWTKIETIREKNLAKPRFFRGGTWT